MAQFYLRFISYPLFQGVRNDMDTADCSMLIIRGFRKLIEPYFTNDDFTNNKLASREGSELDVTRLEKIFTNLGFKVVTKRNRSVHDMLETCKALSKLESLLSSHSAFFLTVLSHGGSNDVIYGSCGNSIALDALIEPFRGMNCKALAGKPKIILVQACRGKLFDQGVSARLMEEGGFDRTKCEENEEMFDENGNELDGSLLNFSQKFQSNFRNRNNFTNIKIPHCADILIAFSCANGYYSWRNKCEGSWFIQSFCEEVENCFSDVNGSGADDIARILTKTVADMAFHKESSSNEECMNRTKQIPCIVSTLTKCLFLADN